MHIEDIRQRCVVDEDTQRETPPLCPHCGDSRQVWRNQITGRWTCHRIHCYREIDA